MLGHILTWFRKLYATCEFELKFERKREREREEARASAKQQKTAAD